MRTPTPIPPAVSGPPSLFARFRLAGILIAAGLYTTAQVQALHIGTPLIQRNPATGRFTLEIGVKKSSNLTLPFADFPLNAPGTTTGINQAGKLLFEFTSPDDAAFFRLQAE